MGYADVPPFKLAQMMAHADDKSSVEYQRLTWDALRKSINGLVNKVSAVPVFVASLALRPRAAGLLASHSHESLAALHLTLAPSHGTGERVQPAAHPA